MKEETPRFGIFPLGTKLPEMYSKYFTGQAYLAPLQAASTLTQPSYKIVVFQLVT